MRNINRKILSLLFVFAYFCTASLFAFSEYQDNSENMTMNASSVSTEGAEIIDSGTHGALYWKLDSDGVLTISGNGEMPKGNITPWSAEKEQIKSLYISYGVTHIAPYAFADCRNMENAVLPDSLEIIGYNAFLDCMRLTSVNLPDFLEYLGDSAFAGCKSLKNITLPPLLENIGDYCFISCTSLKSITLPAELKSVGREAFYGCDRLTDVVFSGTKAEWNKVIIGERNEALINATLTFPPIASGSCGANLTWEYDEDGLLIISGTGEMNDLENNVPWWDYREDIVSAVISDKVTSIGSYAFCECRNLKTINLPASLESIHAGAFLGCGLTSIDLPNRIMEIGEAAFAWCEELTSVKLPSEVTEIQKDAFCDCKNLNTIVFSGSVPRFADNCFSGVHADAYIPANTNGWTSEAKANYEGQITWKELQIGDAETAKARYETAREIYSGNISSAEMNTDSLSTIQSELLIPYQSISTGHLDDSITYEGTALTFDDAILIRHFFTVQGDINQYTFRIDGETTTPVPCGQYYTIDAEQISFEEMNKRHSIEVTAENSEWTMNCCALSYAYEALLSETDDNLCTLMKTMYLYYLAK